MRVAGKPYVEAVQIRNYKSIGDCNVRLMPASALGSERLPLTILVGRNGSGKSNFLDALRFVVDALQNSLDFAIRERGGIDEVRRRSTGHPRNFSIALRLQLPGGSQRALYSFEITARKAGFAVKSEYVRIEEESRVIASYVRGDSEIIEAQVGGVPLKEPPPVLPDRLYLVNAAGLPEFRSVYDSLTAMGFYNLNPQAIKELHSPDAGELLHRDGSNIASVIARLENDDPETMDRIRTYLASIVPDITSVKRVALGPKESLQFGQRVQGAEHPWKFYASSMSDGTLRALGALVAVMQRAPSRGVTFVGIEEPETALHPAAAGALMDALREAARQTQVAVTTHSPDLLDQVDADQDTLLVVDAKEGTSQIARTDAASRDAIRKHLYTAGDLLRMDQLQPDPTELRRPETQLFLFPERA